MVAFALRLGFASGGIHLLLVTLRLHGLHLPLPRQLLLRQLNGRMLPGLSQTPEHCSFVVRWGSPLDSLLLAPSLPPSRYHMCKLLPCWHGKSTVRIEGHIELLRPGSFVYASSAVSICGHTETKTLISLGTECRLTAEDELTC